MEKDEEFKAKINLAKRLSGILCQLYNGVNADGLPQQSFPNTDINTLLDFWIYTSGYIAVEKFESVLETMDDNKLRDIINGHFVIKNPTEAQCEKILKDAGKTLPKSGYTKHVDLYTIQDGKYSLDTFTLEDHHVTNQLVLDTEPLEIYSDYLTEQTDPSVIIKTIRNVFAHSTPYINGSILTFNKRQDSVVTTKMWLRGLTEAHSKLDQYLEPATIKPVLERLANEETITFSNEKEVNRALSALLPLFDEDVKHNFFRVNNFAHDRLRFCPDFYSLPVEKKIDILSGILSYSSHMLRSRDETPNANILYAIQKMVLQECLNRNVDIYLDDDDKNMRRLIEINEQKQKYEQEFNDMKTRFVRRTGFYDIKLKQLKANVLALANELQRLRAEVVRVKSLEFSNMYLNESSDLENLSVESAFNIMCLLAYNSVVTSSFHERMTQNDFTDLDPDIKHTLGMLSFKKFNLHRAGEIKDSSLVVEKAYAIDCIRNALCHCGVSYRFPRLKQGETADFKDVIVTFASPNTGKKVEGRLEDFANLFMNQLFFKGYNDQPGDGKVF